MNMALGDEPDGPLAYLDSMLDAVKTMWTPPHGHTRTSWDNCVRKVEILRDDLAEIAAL